MSKKKKKIKIENNGAEPNTASKVNAEFGPTPPETAGEKPTETPPQAEPNLEMELEDLKQRLQRLGADYQNYQKRSQRQIEQATQFAREDLVKSLLPVLDNFDHTLEKGAEAQDGESLLKGVQIVYDHLLGVLTSAGMKRIEVNQGDSFDPALHQAMLHEPSDQFPENAVLRELAPGYTMNDRTLRPAKVSIAKAPAEEKPPAATEEETNENQTEQPEK